MYGELIIINSNTSLINLKEFWWYILLEFISSFFYVIFKNRIKALLVCVLLSSSGLRCAVHFVLMSWFFFRCDMCAWEFLLLDSGCGIYISLALLIYQQPYILHDTAWALCISNVSSRQRLHSLSFVVVTCSSLILPSVNFVCINCLCMPVEVLHFLGRICSMWS